MCFGVAAPASDASLGSATRPRELGRPVFGALELFFFGGGGGQIGAQGFGVQGFRGWGLGFQVLGFRV